jgi:hypothetical protein
MHFSFNLLARSHGPTSRGILPALIRPRCGLFPTQWVKIGRKMREKMCDEGSSARLTLLESQGASVQYLVREPLWRH